MNIDPPRRWETVAAQERLYILLNLDQGGVYPFPGDIQDFELVLSNPQRLAEYCELYDTAPLDQDAKYLLGKLIVASLDDLLAMEHPTGEEAAASTTHVELLLRRDFLLHFHTIDYWRESPRARTHRNKIVPAEMREDPRWEDFDGWAVTPMMRRIWADCFRPEYAVWHEETFARAEAVLQAALVKAKEEAT